MFDNSTGIIQECYLSMIVVTLIIHVCSLMNVPAGTNALYENAAAAFSHSRFINVRGNVSLHSHSCRAMNEIIINAVT